MTTAPLWIWVAGVAVLRHRPHLWDPSKPHTYPPGAGHLGRSHKGELQTGGFIQIASYAQRAPIERVSRRAPISGASLRADGDNRRRARTVAIEGVRERTNRDAIGHSMPLCGSSAFHLRLLTEIYGGTASVSVDGFSRSSSGLIRFRLCA